MKSMRTMTCGFFAMILLPGVMASAYTRDAFQDSVYVLRDQLNKTSKLDQRNCSDAYKKIYQNDTLKISMFNGYENMESETTDRMHRRAMIKVLTSRCASGNAACEFKLNKEVNNFAQLEKMIDGKKVVIDMYSTSVTESNVRNMDFNDPAYYQQEAQSQAVKNQFYNDLVKSDVVFYMGHSRVGAGLGFDSQNWVQTGINYVFRFPLKPILNSLATRPSRLKVFGLFSCSSENYYRAEIERVNPNISLILSTDEIEFDEAPQAEIGALDSLLAKRCAKEFHQSLVTTTAPKHDVMKFIHRAR